MKLSALNRVVVAGAAAVVACVLLAGCRESKSPAMQRIDTSNLRILAKLWNQCTGQNRGKAPASEQEFKTLIKGIGAERLAAMKIGDVDKLFVSERDNKPYTIVYGQQSGSPGSGGGVMGYEQEGKDGKRLVALTHGEVKEVEEAEFQKLVPAVRKP